MFTRNLYPPLTKTRTLCKKYDGNTSFLYAKRSMSQDADKLSQMKIERKIYNDALPDIINSLVSKSRISRKPEIGTHLRQLFDYNLKSGNNSQGLITMLTYSMLETPKNYTEEKHNLSKVLGWCVEIMHCSVFLVDDMLDEATLRRGAPCWHNLDNIGNLAANDSLLLICCITEIVETYFSRSPQMSKILQIYHKVLLTICIGQYDDNAIPKKRDSSLYTMKHYDDSVYYKTSYNVYHAPIELGTILVTDVHNKINIKSNSVYSDICFKFAKLFQMQNDYNDLYIDAGVTGKVSSDIQNGKCTWFAVTTLQRCNELQRQRFVEYYGSSNPEHVAHIKSLYTELNMPALYKKETISIHDDVVRIIRTLPSKSISKFFYKLLDDLLLGSGVWGGTKIEIH